jgi:hypothetical protein
MTEDTDQPAYRVQPEGERFCVVDQQGRVLIVCGDARNADQYVVLMNQSYQSGFTAGVRKQRGGIEN